MFFSSDPAVSSSIFVGAEREELIRNDPDKSEFTTCESAGCEVTQTFRGTIVFQLTMTAVQNKVNGINNF